MKIGEKRPSLFNICVKKEVLITLIINGQHDRTGSYICGTCKDSMLAGKIPAMAEINGLQLFPTSDDFHLTELENNLIALNINFQYIFFLRNSRWAAMRKQMISVPSSSVLNTVHKLPRMPKEAGLIPVMLKRKKEYKSYHKREYIDPEKIFNVLALLKKYGHPHYQFYTDISKY